uniref:Uncharacterized protein n=1 Tax=Strigamia maritima TaxID=126957 RepID=T1JBI1_STRMM
MEFPYICCNSNNAKIKMITDTEQTSNHNKDTSRKRFVTRLPKVNTLIQDFTPSFILSGVGLRNKNSVRARYRINVSQRASYCICYRSFDIGKKC